MFRQIDGMEYELKFSPDRKRIQGRLLRGKMRVYAPEGTDPEKADEYVKLHYGLMKCLDELEKRAEANRWPDCFLRTRLRAPEKLTVRRRFRSK